MNARAALPQNCSSMNLVPVRVSGNSTPVPQHTPKVPPDLHSQTTGNMRFEPQRTCAGTAVFAGTSPREPQIDEGKNTKKSTFGIRNDKAKENCKAVESAKSRVAPKIVSRMKSVTLSVIVIYQQFATPQAQVAPSQAILMSTKVHSAAPCSLSRCVFCQRSCDHIFNQRRTCIIPHGARMYQVRLGSRLRSRYAPVSFHRNASSSAMSSTSCEIDTPELCPALSS